MSIEQEICSDCVDENKCKKYKICLSLLESYDIFTEEIKKDGKNKLRIIRVNNG